MAILVICEACTGQFRISLRSMSIAHHNHCPRNFHRVKHGTTFANAPVIDVPAKSDEKLDAVEVSDEGESLESDEEVQPRDSKRQRLDVQDQDKLMSRVLMEIAQNDGYLPLNDICTDIQDRGQILKTVQALVAENKLMTEENDDGTLDVLAISD